jgi:hypothetical protein
MDAGRLLERCAKQDEASAAAEMGAWRAAHGPTVFRRTGAFARSICDLGLRMLALAAVDAEDPAAVEVVRGLREGPRTRPDATLRLVERRLEEPPALDAATSAVLVQALAVLLAHGTRGGRCRGRPQGHLQAGLGPGAPERRPRGCHHPAASSSLMRLRLRLWVARTDAR